MSIQAFIFDFDGVLADSVEIKTKAFREIFEPFGSEIMNKVATHHRNNGGMSRKQKFDYYYKNFIGKSLSDNLSETLCEKFSKLVVDEVVSAPEIPGAVEFLKKIPQDTLCFVNSATPDHEITMIVKRRGLKTYFREILGSGFSKTENLQNLIKRYKFDPAKSIFFGDAEGDYRAAVGCNVPFIGIVPGKDSPLVRQNPNIKWYEDFTKIDLLKL